MALDGLRGFGVTTVLLYHFSPTGIEESWIYPFLGDPNYYVRLFFLLSGYLLAGLLEKRRTHEHHFLSNHYLRRVVRIFPLYWLSLLLCLWPPIWPGLMATVANIFMLFGFLGFKNGYIWNYSAWSLFCEEIFYLISPFLIPARRPLLLFFALTAASFGIASLWLPLQSKIDPVMGQYFVFFSPLANFHFLFGGCSLFYLLHKTKIGSWRIPNLINASILISLAAWMIYREHLASLFLFPNAFLFVLAFLILKEDSFVAKILRTPPLPSIGLRCYSIYILSLPLQHIFKKSLWPSIQNLLPPTFGSYELDLFVSFAVFFPFLFSFCLLAEAYFARPLTNKVQHWIQNRERLARGKAQVSADPSPTLAS